MVRDASRSARNAPRTLMASTVSSGPVSRAAMVLLGPVVPALTTTPVMGPRVAAWWNNAAVAASSAASARTAIALPPAAVISCTSASAGAGSRE